MTEENTEAVQPMEVALIKEPQIKSKKARSEFQLKALAAARQKAYTVRADNAELKKARKKTENSNEDLAEIPEVSKDISKVDSKDDSKDDLPENKNENIRDDVKK